jgi:hypothetical protein
LVQADSAAAILELLQRSATLSQYAAGTSLDAVNFSTAWTRLARLASANSFVRSQVLNDPRSALLLSCTAEALATNPQKFDARGLANLAWALAKFNVSPPQSEQGLLVQLPRPPTSPTALDLTANGQSHVELESRKALLDVATTVRQIVLNTTRERSNSDGEQRTPRWIPALSQLTGHLLDATGEETWYRASTSVSPTSVGRTPLFQMRDWSNLLWAWSTADRANEALFGLVIRTMIAQHEATLRVDGNDLSKPQDWSNAIWAVATAQCYDGDDDLLVYVAQLLDQYPHFVGECNSQDISDTIWGVATLISGKKQARIGFGDAVLSEREQQAAFTIARHCLQSVVRRQAKGFNSQELSIIAWAAATLGFGLTATTSAAVASPSKSVVLSSQQPIADALLVAAAIQNIGVAARPLLPRFSPQELSNLAWALARLLGDASNAHVVAARGGASSWPDNVRVLLSGIGRHLADHRCTGRFATC